MEKVLEISHLSKKFGQQYALNDVNLTIRKGDVYGLIGKNGAGKTTLIKVITQLIQETDGSVSLFASTNRSQWTQALKRVGSVIESPVAHKHMTAYQNLVYYCKARHIPNPDQVIKETLNYVGLNNTGKKKFRDFFTRDETTVGNCHRAHCQARLPHFGRTHQWSRSCRNQGIPSDDQAPQR